MNECFKGLVEEVASLLRGTIERLTNRVYNGMKLSDARMFDGLLYIAKDSVEHIPDENLRRVFFSKLIYSINTERLDQNEKRGPIELLNDNGRTDSIMWLNGRGLMTEITKKNGVFEVFIYDLNTGEEAKGNVKTIEEVNSQVKYISQNFPNSSIIWR